MQLESLSYKELQAICKERGLKASGKAGDLIERLREVLGKEEVVAEQQSEIAAPVAEPMPVANDEIAVDKAVAVEPAVGAAVAEEQVASCEVQESNDGLESMSRRELQQLCKQHGIKASGKTPEIVAALRSAMNTQVGAPVEQKTEAEVVVEQQQQQHEEVEEAVAMGPASGSRRRSARASSPGAAVCDAEEMPGSKRRSRSGRKSSTVPEQVVESTSQPEAVQEEGEGVNASRGSRKRRSSASSSGGRKAKSAAEKVSPVAALEDSTEGVICVPTPSFKATGRAQARRNRYSTGKPLVELSLSVKKARLAAGARTPSTPGESARLALLSSQRREKAEEVRQQAVVLQQRKSVASASGTPAPAGSASGSGRKRPRTPVDFDAIDEHVIKEQESITETARRRREEKAAAVAAARRARVEGITPGKTPRSVAKPAFVAKRSEKPLTMPKQFNLSFMKKLEGEAAAAKPIKPQPKAKPVDAAVTQPQQQQPNIKRARVGAQPSSQPPKATANVARVAAPLGVSARGVLKDANAGAATKSKPADTAVPAAQPVSKNAVVAVKKPIIAAAAAAAGAHARPATATTATTATVAKPAAATVTNPVMSFLPAARPTTAPVVASGVQNVHVAALETKGVLLLKNDRWKSAQEKHAARMRAALMRKGVAAPTTPIKA